MSPFLLPPLLALTCSGDSVAKAQCSGLLCDCYGGSLSPCFEQLWQLLKLSQQSWQSQIELQPK